MHEAQNLHSLLTKVTTQSTGETVSVREVLQIIGYRSYGPILLLCGFIAISPLTLIPGANWAVALMTLLISGQILIGWPTPWLPQKLLEISVSRSLLLQAIENFSPIVQSIDTLVKPRFIFLTYPPFLQVGAVTCIFAALITFPLGLVPFGPVLPSLAILLYGIGLTTRDGLLLLSAIGTLGLAIAIFIRLGALL